MTALEVVRGFEAIGGKLTPEPPDKVRWVAPIAPPPPLLDALRERKADLLQLLRRQPCPLGHPAYWWYDSAGQPHCGTCTPDPTAHRLRGVTIELLGDRAISLTPPTGDLPAPGSWAKTAAGGAAELVLYEASGGEVLMRSLRGERLQWFKPEQLSWETNWRWS